MIQKKRTLISCVVVIILHVVGVAGTLYEPTQAFVVSLTPINLFVSTILFFLSISWPVKKNVIVLASTIAIIGYLVEVVGVATGLPFGVYRYGTTLGISMWKVPLIMGINWLLLTAALSQITERFPFPNILKSVLGAALMTVMDVMIEPIAIKLDYWSWEETEIPIENYLSWFVISLLLHMLTRKVGVFGNRQFAICLIISQIMYFTLLNIFL